MRGRRGQMSIKWVVGVVIAACAAVGAGIGIMKIARAGVTVTLAVEGPVVQAFYSTGTVAPQREYPIKSNIAGTLEDVRVDKGDAVRAGDVLAIVADSALDYQHSKALAELQEKIALADDKNSPVLHEYDARLSATNEMLAIAQREQARLLKLAEANAASQTDVDRATDHLKQVWIEAESIKTQKAAKKLSLLREVKVAEAALKTAQWNLDQQTVRSPIEGIVLDRPTSRGTRVAINDHIMQIADLSPANLVMRAAVDEEDKNKVRLGQTVRMTLYSFPDEVFRGIVDRIYDKADESRRTFEVDVRIMPVTVADALPFEIPLLLEKRFVFSPGMTGELAFIMAAKDKAIVVPSQALQAGQIWGVHDGRLVKLNAAIGLKSVERVEVKTGVNVGDRIVVSPIGTLREGQAVSVDVIDPKVAAEMNRPKEKEGTFRGFN
jgi:HlyD family secretion protein